MAKWKGRGVANATAQQKSVQKQEHRLHTLAQDDPQADGLCGRTFGAWTAVRADQTGKRVTVICGCGTLRQVALDALSDGSSTGCGCKVTPPGKTPSAAPTYASVKWRAP